jgi:glutamate synthase domain-containing protein 2
MMPALEPTDDGRQSSELERGVSTLAWVVIGVVAALLLALLVILVHDIFQRRHALLRAYPVVGRARFLLEKVGPELRQYWFLGDKEERPFNRTQRNWVYQTAKGVQNTFGFGTEIEPDTTANYLIVKHAPFPYPTPSKGQVTGPPDFYMPSAKVLGEHRGRRHAFRPNSAVNVSAMSFGSLSGPAVESINRGVAAAGALQNTGEGGLSPHHKHGGDLLFQIGTGYFGCRDRNGHFSLSELKGRLEEAPIRALEIKLSQGAKPGLGGLLPAAKVTQEIANVREVAAHEDCVSPSSHTAFGDVDEMLDFVEMLADETGLPVGVKSAVGEDEFWEGLAQLMARGDRGVDFITVDGGEGGTGAAPLVFTDHVALPLKMGIARVQAAFAREGIADRVTLIGSGKLGFPEAALFAFALGCDMVNVAREAMMAIGCIQAQICHTGECPVGVATQSKWLTRALYPPEKSERLARYITSLRGEVMALSRACGVPHPALVSPDHLEVVDAHFNGTGVRELFGYEEGWGTHPLGELEGMLEEIDEDRAHERREAAAAHGMTPFPEV